MDEQSDELLGQFLDKAAERGLAYGQTIAKRAKYDQVMRQLAWLYVCRGEDPAISAWCCYVMGLRIGEGARFHHEVD